MARNLQAKLERESFWRWIVEGQRSSELSVRAWCSQNNVRESAFCWWRRELAKRDGKAGRSLSAAEDGLMAGAFEGAHIVNILPTSRPRSILILERRARVCRHRRRIDILRESNRAGR